MAADKFNSLTGYSVGLPPIDAIAANGNIVTNHNYPAGNVTSNTYLCKQLLLCKWSGVFK